MRTTRGTRRNRSTDPSNLAQRHALERRTFLVACGLVHCGSMICPNPAEVAEIAWKTAVEMAALPDLLESNHHFLNAYAAGQIVLP